MHMNQVMLSLTTPGGASRWRLLYELRAYGLFARGMSYRAIGEQCGVSRSMARVIVYRGWRIVRFYLGKPSLSSSEIARSTRDTSNRERVLEYDMRRFSAEGVK